MERPGSLVLEDLAVLGEAPHGHRVAFSPVAILAGEVRAETQLVVTVRVSGRFCRMARCVPVRFEEHSPVRPRSYDMLSFFATHEFPPTTSYETPSAWLTSPSPGSSADSTLRPNSMSAHRTYERLAQRISSPRPGGNPRGEQPAAGALRDRWSRWQAACDAGRGFL
jgi:hypothetical protein